MPGWIAAAWHYYWQQTSGNVLAVPFCAAVAAVLAVPFYFVRDKIGRRVARWFAAHLAPHLAEHLGRLPHVDDKQREQLANQAGVAPDRPELATDAGKLDEAAEREHGSH